MGLGGFLIKLIVIPILFVIAIIVIVYLIKQKRSRDKIEKDQASRPALMPWSMHYNPQLTSPAPVHVSRQQHYPVDVEQGLQQTGHEHQITVVDSSKVTYPFKELPS